MLAAMRDAGLCRPAMSHDLNGARRPVRRAAAGLVLTCLTTIGFPAQAQTQRQIGRYIVTERSIGGWLLKSSAGPLGAYCTIERNEGARTFGYQMTRSGQRFIGLSSTTWRRPPGTFESVRLSVGGATLWSGRAAAPIPETLALPIDAGSRIDPVAILVRSDLAKAEITGQVTTFDLTGVAEALAAQKACLAEER